MKRRIGSPLAPGLGALALAVCVAVTGGGCGGTEESCQADDTCASTTPEPTPDPADPVYTFYWITRLDVADSDQGLDLDGDGDIDNGLPYMLEVVGQFVSSAVESALCGDTPCTEDQADLLARAQSFIETAFSLPTLSWAISNPIQTGQATYLMELTGDSLADPLSFTLYLSKTPETDTSRCVITGMLDDAGGGRFGTCDLHVITESYGSADSDVSIALDLIFSETQIQVDTFGWSGFEFTGGAVVTSPVLLAAIEQVILVMNEAMDAGIPVEVAIRAIEGMLPTYADYDTDGDGVNDAFSIGVLGEASDRPAS